MSFLRHERSIVRWGFEGGPRANQSPAPLPPSHRLDESQPVIPRQVALLHCLLPLHQPVSSSLRSAGTVNRDRTKVAGFSTGIMLDFQPVLTGRSTYRLAGPPAPPKSQPVPTTATRAYLKSTSCKQTRVAISTSSCAESCLAPFPSIAGVEALRKLDC
jgi:hypothetical protein